MTRHRARTLARALARFEDPELKTEGAGLPDRVGLLPLLELVGPLDAAVAERWRGSARSLRVRAVLGVTEREVFEIDLDDDGPHGLIAGTTGSGKSELLRTLIASMAVGAGPEHLTFALVDYKGGGALDECARLPHVVGLVTDLDEQLGERALRCLEAELRHREHALRGVGLGHVRDYQQLRDMRRPELEPMPRLVVVIDEFATLVKALPEFVDALVSIAQRGRSLGMHLIMAATQRPAKLGERRDQEQRETAAGPAVGERWRFTGRDRLARRGRDRQQAVGPGLLPGQRERGAPGADRAVHRRDTRRGHRRRPHAAAIPVDTNRRTRRK